MVSKSTGRAFVQMRGTGWSAQVKALAVLSEPPALLEGALWVRLSFRFLAPKVTKRPYPTVRPDVDRLVAGLLDALNGVVYEDDKQVVRLTATKTYGEIAGVRLEVGRLEGGP
jgi:Holliday junction resolvase RusA-like endonuclease